MKQIDIWWKTPIGDLYFYLVKIIDVNPQFPDAYIVKINVNSNL